MENLTIIKEYARVAYIKKGLKAEDIINEINEMYQSKYTLNAFKKWKVEGEWDKELAKRQLIKAKNDEIVKKLPSIETINQDQLQEILDNQRILKETIKISFERIQKLKDSDKGFSAEVTNLTRLTNAYKDGSVAIDKIGNKIIVGKESDLKKIFEKMRKNKERREKEKLVEAEIVE